MRRVITALAVTAAMLGSNPGVARSAQAQSDESNRLRQLEAFEQLLTQTVKERIDGRVAEAIDSERAGDGTGNATGSNPLVVRVGSASGAHGMYIADYGIIFSIQTPQISVIPAGFERHLAAPMESLRFGTTPRGQIRSIAPPRVIELRGDVIMRTLDDMLVMIEREDLGVQAEELHQVRADVAQILAKVRTDADPPGEAPADTTDAPEISVNLRTREPGVDDRGVRVGLYELFRSTEEAQLDMRRVLERNQNTVTSALNSAAIDTLANYGSLLKGLQDDDRVSILVLPPNRWVVADQHGIGERAEYVISVRRRDIRDLDNEKIDLVEFRDRVRIHSRLGSELPVDGAPR